MANHLKATHCKICGVERTKENWRPYGAYCSKCFYKKYKSQKTNDTLQEIKKLADEIVVNCKRKTRTGILCACRDLVKFYDKHNISVRDED